MDLLIQFLGLGLLLGGIVFGYLRWVKPRTDLSMQAKGLLLLVILTLMGGAIGGVGWWTDDPRSFAWDLPPLASRMLAAAGWAFAAVTLMALQRPSYQRVRLVLLMLFTYLVPLTVAIFLFHLNRFDFRAPISYSFFLIVIIMVVADIVYLIRQPQVISSTPQDEVAPSQLVKGWLVVLAIVTALWGLALFVTDAGFSNLIWVWSGDLLTSRLIAVMLLTIAVSAVYSLRHADTAKVLLITAVVYGVGLAAASLWNGVAGLPIKYSYVVVFGAMAIISVIIWQRERQLA